MAIPLLLLKNLGLDQNNGRTNCQTNIAIPAMLVMKPERYQSQLIASLVLTVVAKLFRYPLGSKLVVLGILVFSPRITLMDQKIILRW